MTCPRCQQENPAEAHFCMKCGTGLTLTCAKCNTELPTGAAFCFACGQPVAAAPGGPRFTSPDAYTPRHLAEKILTSKSALEGERKQPSLNTPRFWLMYIGFRPSGSRPESCHRSRFFVHRIREQRNKDRSKVLALPEARWAVTCALERYALRQTVHTANGGRATATPEQATLRPIQCGRRARHRVRLSTRRPRSASA